MGRGIGPLSQKEDEQVTRKNQAWWGIAGLLMVVSFVAIAIVLSKPVAESTSRLVPGIDANTWQIFVGGGIFVFALAISGIIFSLFAPKKKDKFSERELDRERKAIQAEHQAKLDRQKMMRKQIAKARREGK